MDGKEEFRRVGVGYAIMIGQLFDFVALAVNIVAADLAEENLPLAEECLCLGAVGFADKGMNEPHSPLSAQALGAEVGGQVLRRERKPPRTQ